MKRFIKNALILAIVFLAALCGALYVHTDFVYKTDTHGKVTKTVSFSVTPAAHALVVAGADSVREAPSVTKKTVLSVSHAITSHAHHAVASVEAVTRDVGVVVFDGVQAVVTDTTKKDTTPVKDTTKTDTAKTVAVIQDTAKKVDSTVASKGGTEITKVDSVVAKADSEKPIDRPVAEFAKYERVLFQGVIAAPSMDTVDMTVDQHDKAADAAMQAIRAKARAERGEH